MPLFDLMVSFVAQRCAATMVRDQAEAASQLQRQTIVMQNMADAAQHETDIAEARLGKVIDGEFVDVTNERLLTKD